LPLGSSAVVVMDAADRKLLLAKNEDAVLPMASITKLMTGMVVLESKVAMDQPITITEDDIDRARMSRSRLRAGTVLTRAEALHLALMSSENRAAHALGRTYPGGLEAFVRKMNARARELGMAQTRYVDPTGLSSDNQSSPQDLARLVLAASKYPVLREYSTTPKHLTAVGERTLQYNNSNRLVKSPHWDIELQKTGYIIEAGHCVAMRAEFGERDLVIVLLDAGDNRTRTADAERIRRWIAPETVHAERREGVERKAAADARSAKRKEASRKASAQKSAQKRPQNAAPAKATTQKRTQADVADNKPRRVTKQLKSPERA